jgi:hypothetical protein
MSRKPSRLLEDKIGPFDRRFYDSDKRMSSIGSGSLGGKAQGLALINDLILYDFDSSSFPDVDINVPSMTVIRTSVYDALMERNNLMEIANSDASDDRILHKFLMSDLPFEILGDLRALIEQVHSPLAIRSSSLLEDATYEPFAGVYATKMIPNDQYDSRARFHNLVQAIKFIYASTFFKSAKSYREATGHNHEDEKMAVIIQEVVGKRFRNRFYPELSGVARSYNFYPVGRAKHEEGVVNLALGLGKTVVDGGISWAYSPAYPKIGPPYGSVNTMIRQSQRQFWAIDMGSPPAYSPQQEIEYLIQEDLSVADQDGTLQFLCSTYDVQSDRLVVGTSIAGPRVLTFSPILVYNQIHLNEIIKSFLSLCQEELGVPVEIEFAMRLADFYHPGPHRLGFLQVRPMVVSSKSVDVGDDDMISQNVLVASENILGNGVLDDIRDIVYVIPGNFEKKSTQQMANELEQLNRKLLQAKKPYLLIVFGRLGSSDPWLGIPVNWGQIAGTKVIVEAALEGMNVEMSQGSHFFHNLTSLGVSYFSVVLFGKFAIDWEWLSKQEELESTQYIRHVRIPIPLKVMMDGRTGRGVVLKP